MSIRLNLSQLHSILGAEVGVYATERHNGLHQSLMSWLRAPSPPPGVMVTQQLVLGILLTHAALMPVIRKKALE